ncbi:hypothetical protein D9M68_932660 [compost metagenome]
MLDVGTISHGPFHAAYRESRLVGNGVMRRSREIDSEFARRGGALVIGQPARQEIAERRSQMLMHARAGQRVERHESERMARTVVPAHDLLRQPALAHALPGLVRNIEYIHAWFALPARWRLCLWQCVHVSLLVLFQHPYIIN